MAVRVVVDVFSGRPNPAVELEGGEADALLERLRPVGAPEPQPAPPESILGYRGIVVEQVSAVDDALPASFRLVHGRLYAGGVAYQAADAEVEQFLLSASGPVRAAEPQAGFADRVLDEVANLRSLLEEYEEELREWRDDDDCVCAPLYEPTWWNDGANRQFNNNCYNYSTNYRTDTFAQPGQAAGAMYGALTCAAVGPAALADDLLASPDGENECPDEGHLVALVIAPGWDFHWYRKGRNGFWTHKPGGTPATNVDNSGKHIRDPRTANRGPYTDFCSFMIVKHGHIKIN